MRIYCGVVQAHYPLLCKALRISEPPPYKDFAKQLAGEPTKGQPAVMPRKRKEDWQQGKRRGTATWYLVPDLAAAVVRLPKRKRG